MKFIAQTFVFTLMLAVTASARDLVVSPGDSLENARDAAHSGDRIILHGGTYRLDETLVLGPQNSGVTWMAAPGETPVLSGGVPVTGWTPDTHGRFKATVNLDNFRQLWVNGRRAQRARGPVPAGLKFWGKYGRTDLVAHDRYWDSMRPERRGKFDAEVKPDPLPDNANGNLQYAPGTLVNIGKAGYTTTDANLADWRNPGDIEFVFDDSWTHSIAKVETITKTGSGAIIEMSQPGFFLCCNKGGIQEQSRVPSYMENALELLDQPGQWYFDRPAHILYYMPRPGEDMAKAQVIAPKLEMLIEVKGAQSLRFTGMTFAYATWLRPSTNLGHPDLQANFIQPAGNSYFRPEFDYAWVPLNGESVKSPANVMVDGGHGIRFDSCTFTALGGAGLDLQDGTQSNVVEGCRFFDIAGNGIQVGDVTRDDHHRRDPRRIVKDNRIINNSISRVGQEYTDAVGVFYGYTDGTVIAHNEIFDVPYSGISGGWGWGMTDAGGGAYASAVIYKDPTVCKNNRIEFNEIHNTNLLHNDGGGVYMLGRQPGTIIRGNYIHDAGRGPGGVYLDEGSADIEVTGNVITKVPEAIHLNNQHQNRIASCRIHDNYLSAPPVIVSTVDGRRALKAGSVVEMPDEPRLNPAQFTLTAWVRLDKVPAGGDPRRWIACQAPNEWADRNISLIVSSKYVAGYLNIGGGPANCLAATGTSDPLPLNQWTQVALSYDGDTLRIYQNGKEVGEKKIGKARVPAAAPWTLGSRSDRYGTFDCGDIADVRLYNRALAPEELHGDGAAGSGGLLQAWDFEKLPEQDETARIIAAAGLEPAYRNLLNLPTTPSL